MKDYSLKKTLAAAGSVFIIGVVSSSLALAQKPKNISLSIDNNLVSLETSAKRVSDVLEGIGYKFEEGSKINFNLDEKIQNNMSIKIDTQKDISFTKSGILLNTKTHANSVREFLNEQNVKVDGDDLVTPSLDSKIKSGDKVNVDFYDIQKYTKKEIVKFSSKKEFSFDMNYGSEKVKVKGVNGEKTLNFEKALKNGKLISDKKVSETVTKKPIEQVTLVGTKEVIVESIENQVEYRNNDSMYEDEEKVIQSGNEGSVEKIYKNDGKNRELVSSRTLESPTKRIVEVGTKERVVSQSSSYIYSISDLEFHGVIYWGGYKYTYYSESVLPGGGLDIPGRHVNSGGYVADEDGYIVLASDKPLGTILPTPFGYMGKVYDRGTYGNHLDVYTR